MREWRIQEYRAKADASLPSKLLDRAKQTVTAAKRTVGERYRPPDVVTKASALAAFELPQERHLVEELRGNKAAFQEVADWVGIEDWRTIYDQVNRQYDLFERDLHGNSRSDSLGSSKPVKVDGKEVFLDIVRAHDSRYYPFTIPNPRERVKLVSFMGYDFVAATMFETRDGLGSRFSRLYAQMPGEDFLLEVRHRDNDGQPLAISDVFEQLQQDGVSLPIGLTLYGIQEDDPLAYAARVLTLPIDPNDPKPDPRLAILSPKEDGNLFSAEDKAAANNQRIGVRVKDVHVAVARNFYRPAPAIRYGNKIFIPATHVVERDKAGDIERVDGVKRSFDSLPEFPYTHYYIIDPVEGEVDEDVRKERKRLATPSGKNNEDRIGHYIGVDVVRTGGTADKLELDDVKAIVSAQLAAVRSVPRSTLPDVINSASSRTIYSLS